MAYTPSRGDIVHLEFDPSAGREIKRPHYGLVLSGKTFNQMGLLFICPISQGAAASARTYGTVVTLMGCGVETQGAIHCHQLKSVDWRTRKASFKEKVPDFIVDDVLARIDSIMSD